MDRWYLTQKPKNPVWREAAYLGRGTSPLRRTTPVKMVVNLVLDPPGNVVFLTPNLDLYISASLGYHMRRRKLKVGSLEPGSGAPVYTLKESIGLQGLPEFSQGIIHWGQGAVTRTPDGRLIFNKNKAIRQGLNLFHNLPTEILSNIEETGESQHRINVPLRMHASSQPLGEDTNEGGAPWHLSHQRERKSGESHERLLQYGKLSDGPDLSTLPRINNPPNAEFFCHQLLRKGEDRAKLK